LTFTVGFAGLVVFGPWILDMLGSRTPLSAVGTMMLIAAVLGLDLIPGSHSALLLNFNRAPHAVWYLATGLCSIMLAVVLGWWCGAPGVLLAPLLCGAAWLYWRVPVAAWAVLREGEQTKRNTVC
jgi:polyferredoxin